uniref:Threonine aldolase n=1 Tax=Strigomonas oncopelti TaxID=5657 RepID=U5KLN6_STROO|nr:threonine aldolase [Strigomonas oncopelti]
MSEAPHVIDLRSDTISLPTDAMRQVMATAEVGDDVYGEDPTCQKLEKKAAELLGKEAAIFVCSGTMGNLLACMVYGAQPMTDIVIGQKAHVMRYERGGINLLAHASTYQIPNDEDGTLPLESIREVLSRPPDIHRAQARVVFLENTINGHVLPHAYVQQVRQICDEVTTETVKLHCDGARLWNAAVAQRLTMKEVSAPFDSVQCCLSKGLGAPIGGFLAGTREFVAMARQFRKMIGGGMRQAGIVAAAGIYAMDHHYARLQEDHDNAKLMATLLQEGLAAFSKKLTIFPPETNIFFMEFADPAVKERFYQELTNKRVRVSSLSAKGVRIVLNINVSTEDAKLASKVIIDVLQSILPAQ